MAITVKAMYENGMLKPFEPLPLEECENVQITILRASGRAQTSAGLIACRDPQLIERIASEPIEEL